MTFVRMKFLGTDCHKVAAKHCFCQNYGIVVRICALRIFVLFYFIVCRQVGILDEKSFFIVLSGLKTK